MPEEEDGMQLVNVEVENSYVGGFIYVAPVQEFPSGLFIDVDFVAASLSETSTTPDFVMLFLRVGVVCPNCQNHIVTLLTSVLPWIKMSLSDQWESTPEQ
jgi:hypothetical protein